MSAPDGRPSRVRVLPTRRPSEDPAGLGAASSTARRPRSPRVPRFVATLVALAGILSLLSAPISPLQGDFNAKFDPAWEPRYIYYEAPLSLPRVALAYLEAEGFLRLSLIGARGRLRRRRWWLRRQTERRGARV
jgi:hypothetical protein